MKKILFKGSATALITPFKNGSVDYKRLGELADYQVGHGSDAVVVCGTTGESPTLTALEKLRCVSAVTEAVNGRIPVIAGTATNDTAYSAKLSRFAVREGADAVLAVAPYYNKPTAEGMAEHFVKIAESCGKQIIVYNIPQRSGIEIPDATYESLIKEDVICGVKEASGSISRAALLINRFGEHFSVYSGNDDQVLPFLSLGGAGVISVASNVLPLEMHLLCSLWFEGRLDESRKLFYELLPFMKALFAETNPIPVKACMSELGFCCNELRLPMTEAKPETKELLKKTLSSLISFE